MQADDPNLKNHELLVRFRKVGAIRVVELAQSDQPAAHRFCGQILEQLGRIFDLNNESGFRYEDRLLDDFAKGGVRKIAILLDDFPKTGEAYVHWLREALSDLAARDLRDRPGGQAPSPPPAPAIPSPKASALERFAKLSDRERSSIIVAIILLATKDKDRDRSFKAIADLLVAVGFQPPNCLNAVRTRMHRMRDDHGLLTWTDGLADDIVLDKDGHGHLDDLLSGGIRRENRKILYACALAEFPELKIIADRDGWTPEK